MSINDGGPAFPAPWDAQWNNHGFGGMTLRQWFAGMALQGMLADPDTNATAKVFAERAFEAADAMLAHEARERGEEETTNAND